MPRLPHADRFHPRPWAAVLADPAWELSIDLALLVRVGPMPVVSLGLVSSAYFSKEKPVPITEVMSTGCVCTVKSLLEGAWLSIFNLAAYF